MKAWKQSFAIGIALVMLLATAVPALAAPVKVVPVVFQNRTTTEVFLTLKGPTKTTVELNVGRTTEEVLPGEYDYRYEACGRTFRGTFTVGTTGGSLIIKKCSSSLQTTFVVQNNTGNAFRLFLEGAKAGYAVWIGVGKNTVTVLTGGYQYSATVCGENEQGTFKARAAGVPNWVFDCKDN
jgi:hypothetical protein